MLRSREEAELLEQALLAPQTTHGQLINLAMRRLLVEKLVPLYPDYGEKDYINPPDFVIYF